MYSRDHLFVALGVPLSYWHPCVIIVSADENQYRVEVVAMLSLQFVGLPGMSFHCRPLMAYTYGVMPSQSCRKLQYFFFDALFLGSVMESPK